MSLDLRVAQLERQIASMTRENQKRQVIPWINRSRSVYTLVVGRGNTIYTGAMTLYGINSITSAYSTAFPTQNPSVGTTYDDGVGYGYLVDSAGTVSGTPSWLINSASAIDGVATGNTCVFHVPEGSRVFAVNIMQRSYSGGGTTPAYIIWRT